MAYVTASELEQILSRHDPMGLAGEEPSGGGYLPEAETLAPRLARAGSMHDVRRMLVNAFRGWLGPSYAPSAEELTEPASEVWQMLTSRSL